MEFFHKKTSFPFMATRKVWYTLSTILMLVSITSFFVRGLNFTTEFTGGITIEVNFPEAASVDKVHDAVVAGGYHEPSVATFGSVRDLQIRLQSTGENSDQLRPKFEKILSGVDPRAQITKLDVVGPQVGVELRNAAIKSLTITLLLIAGYIVVRFHTWRLSLGAILAVMHDPILVLGVFSITQTPFDLAVVAAILAVIGYSLNDTVIVFDRIRETFEKNRRLPPDQVLDLAINQTLSRTIMTKVVTSIVVVALLLLGGSTLRGFSEALLIGIIAGTYSSIYISSSIALSFGLKAEHVFPPVRKDALDEMP